MIIDKNIHYAYRLRSCTNCTKRTYCLAIARRDESLEWLDCAKHECTRYDGPYNDERKMSLRQRITEAYGDYAATLVIQNRVSLKCLMALIGESRRHLTDEQLDKAISKILDRNSARLRSKSLGL